MRKNTWTWVGLAGLSVTTALFCLLLAWPEIVDRSNADARILSGGGLLGLVLLSFLVGWRPNSGLALRQAMSWVAVALFLTIGYAYREDFTNFARLADAPRLAAQLVDTQPMQSRRPESRHGVVSLSGDGSGHFWADANVDGTHVRFLVDTGASHIALSPFDAQRLGYDLNALDYRVPYQTANGVAYAAPLTLEDISIGSITISDVQASVLQSGLSQSLLGMSFLGELSAVELSGDRLILRE
eukprot:s1_g1579.t1